MSKDLSAKYYQDNKERQKKSCERCQSLSKEEKDKSSNMALNDIKIWKMKKPENEKQKRIILNEKKHLIIIRNYFCLENFVLSNKRGVFS